MDRQLYRSRDNKVLAGVCGGIAEYFRIDPIIVRILWLVVAPAGGIFIYIIAALLIPQKTQSDFYENDTFKDDFSTRGDPQKNKLVIGGGLILIGIVFILKQVFRWFDTNLFWPLVLIIVGAVVIYRNRRGSF